MGVVFKAEDTRLPGRFVAIKLLNPELVGDKTIRQRFLNEARAASSLDHPNISQIYEIDQTDEGRLFLCMALYEGPSLRDLVASGPMNLTLSMQVVYSLASGLAAAHRNNIIHRDIKPGNVMMPRDGYVKIVDFGLAKLLGDTAITGSDIAVGTVAYMSPEQASGRHVDKRTDIWSLGVLFYEMLTGSRPFRGEVPQAVAHAIFTEEHEPIRELQPEIPESIAKIIDRCLEKDVKKRYGSMEEVMADLLDAARDIGNESALLSVAAAPPASYRLRSKRKRYVWSAVAVAAALATGMWWFGPWRERSPYVTEMRLAVLPFENRLGADYDAYGVGLASVLSDYLTELSETQKSMWVVPERFVEQVDPVDAPAAHQSFGINNVLTGDVQRFGDDVRLTLRLVDENGTERATRAVDYGEDGVPLGMLDASVRHLTGIAEPQDGRIERFFPTDTRAFEAFLSGVGLVRAHPDSAVGVLETVRASMPEFGAAHMATGQAYFETYRDTGDSLTAERAIEELREARRLSPDDARTHYRLGRVFRYTHQPDSAIACSKQALRLQPNNHIATITLARTYRGQNRFDEARDLLVSMAKQRVDFYSDYQELGKLCYWFGEYNPAVEWLRRATKFAPGDDSSINALGVSLYNLGDFVAAREMFERSFRLAPRCDNCNNVASLLYFEGRYEESAQYFETALGYCDSTDHEIWGNWARALYWAPGERDRAVELFARAIALAKRNFARNQNDGEIISSLAAYYAMSGMKRDAREMIERCRPFVRDNPDLMFSLATSNEFIGRRDEALALLGDAIRHGYSIQVIEATPDLEHLRKDPRYQHMVSQSQSETSP